VPTANEIFTVESQGWTLRASAPEQPADAGPLVLLHGWTGDETVMWIFARKLAKHRWVLAPRGPVSAPEGGFGWLPHRTAGGEWPILADFQTAADQVMAALPGWLEQAGVPRAVQEKPLDLMGFSQGAAMALALAAFYPRQVERVAALAGFLPAPAGAVALTVFSGKKIYIAHGTQDETVPVSMAQESARILQSAGAQVTYCESDAGHKLSLSCAKGLEAFLS